MRFKQGESKTPGLRERRVSKTTGTTVSLYNAAEAGIDSESAWVTTCDTHQTMCSHETLADARSELSHCEWCPECRRARGQIIEEQDDGCQRTLCWECGEEIYWGDAYDGVGCQEDDATLLHPEDRSQVVGAHIDGHIYCPECADEKIRLRCQNCPSAEAHGAPESALLLQQLSTEISALLKPGPIEVVDVRTLPEPPPGTWAARLRDELLNRGKGQN